MDFVPKVGEGEGCEGYCCDFEAGEPGAEGFGGFVVASLGVEGVFEPEVEDCAQHADVDDVLVDPHAVVEEGAGVEGDFEGQGEEADEGFGEVVGGDECADEGGGGDDFADQRQLVLVQTRGDCQGGVDDEEPER